MPDSRIGADLRQQVSMRAGGCCEYCRSQARYATQAFSVEHILPRVQGGATRLGNLALAYQGCNNHKYDKVELARMLRCYVLEPQRHRAHRDAEKMHARVLCDELSRLAGLPPFVTGTR